MMPWYFDAVTVCLTLDTASLIVAPVGLLQSIGTVRYPHTAWTAWRPGSAHALHAMGLGAGRLAAQRSAAVWAPAVVADAAGLAAGWAWA